MIPFGVIVKWHIVTFSEQQRAPGDLGMSARGPSQTIQSSRSGEVGLPHAMYSGETDQKPGDLARQLSEEIRERLPAAPNRAKVEY
jgi:hypothetical protein